MKTTFQIKDGRVFWVKDWPEYDIDLQAKALASAVEVEDWAKINEIIWDTGNALARVRAGMGPFIVLDGIYHVDLDGEMVTKDQYRSSIVYCEWDDYDPKVNGPKDLTHPDFEYRQVAVFKPKGSIYNKEWITRPGGIQQLHDVEAESQEELWREVINTELLDSKELAAKFTISRK